MSDIYVIAESPKRNEYGERCGIEWKVQYVAKCVDHYPKSRQGVTGDINTTDVGEIVQNYEIVWINPCECDIIDLCDTDIRQGMFAYLLNKPWKIVGITNYDDCGCNIIKLILERLEPREKHRHLKECVDKFEG